MQDVIAGHIDTIFTSPSIALPSVQAGSLKAYAVFANQLGCGTRNPDRGGSGIAGVLRAWLAARFGPPGNAT
jgi:tripartite-type tricarboxylate transporter receptor subunit TctC